MTSLTLIPFTFTLPFVGERRLSRISTVVVLPDPEGPISAVILPAAMVKLR